MVRIPERRRARPPAGFTLVGMVIVFTVMTVLVAAAMPLWSKMMQRHREEELIFRGLQYAEAIRVFQLRNGRLPIQLEELLKVRPRCIRQLWKDPMTESGDWGLIYAQPAGGGRGQRVGRRRTSGVAPGQRQQPPSFGGSGPRPLGGEERGPQGRTAQAVAPIIGVHSLSDEAAAKSFLGGGSYRDWQFTTEILPVAAVTPDNLNLVRANSRWVGRPFPPDLGLSEGAAPLAQGDTPEKRTRRGGEKRRDQ
jgi:type II secretory pathway pseudopilin PulG